MKPPYESGVNGFEEEDKNRIMPRALVAPDSFKGTFAAADVADALARGFEDAGWDADRCPLADGGEGTAAALLAALGGERIPESAMDPLGREIQASWVLLADGETAVVEVAEASGLGLLRPRELEPLAASTYGTGVLIASAASQARRVLVAVGGSATNDGGRGALAAILEAGGIGSAELVCLCDVETAWEAASRTFGPQKGADEAAVAELERRLDKLAADLPRDPRGVPMTGAAGGLSGGLWAELGADLRPGAAYVCDVLGVDRRIAAADLVVGGEGRLDRTTLEGKALAELAGRCASAKKPFAAVVGSDDSDPGLRSSLGLIEVLEARDPVEFRRAADDLTARGAP